MGNMSRRQVLGRGAVAAAAATLAAQLAAAPRPAGKAMPNILWFVSEDNFPLIGAYGDDLARTPTIDRLARQGILYERAYCTSPVCGPSRFSIVTGMYPESAGSSEDFGSTDEVLPYEIQGYPAMMRAAGYYCTNNAKKNYNSQLDFVDMWDESSNKAHWKNRPAGKPFLSVFNTFATHESVLFNGNKDMWGNPSNLGPVTKEAVARKVPPYLPNSDGVRKDFAAFYNAMEHMDRELAFRLKELEDAGLADDTIIFYYSDNGGITPRGKRFCYELGTRCALVVYVPPKWAHLSPHLPGSRVKEPVSFVDLTPTLLSLAGIEPPRHIHGRALLGDYRRRPAKYVFSGRDRMDERYDMMRSTTDGRFRYIRNYAPHRIWGQHGAFMFQASGYQDWEAGHRAGTLDATQDRFWQTKPYEELYDTVADPHQVHNLADQPAHAAKLAELHRAVDAHILAMNDNGFIPEGVTLQGYINSRQPGAYPLRDIMAMAETAARGDPAMGAALARGLTHPHECMRYWAATGLVILGDRARPHVDALKAAFGREQSVAVRIPLCEALINLVNDQAALRALGDILDQEDDGPFRIQAINSLTYVGEPARPVLPAIRRSADENHRHVRSAAAYLLQVLGGTYDPYRQATMGGGANRLDPEVEGAVIARPYD